MFYFDPSKLSLQFNYHKGINLPMANTTTSAYRAICMAFEPFTSQEVSSSLVEENKQNFTQAQQNF